MIKNLLVLCIFAWVATAAARPHIAQESLREAEAFRVEKAAKEEAQQGRALAGSQIKKKTEAQKDAPSESDSEVQYWQYSE